MKKVKLSEMEIGDWGILDGELILLRIGGKMGGCKYDMCLSLVCDVRNKQSLKQHNIDIDKLPEIIIDGDEDYLGISGIPYQ